LQDPSASDPQEAARSCQLSDEKKFLRIHSVTAAACLLLENKSYSNRVLSLEKVINFFHKVTKEANNNQAHTY